MPAKPGPLPRAPQLEMIVNEMTVRFSFIAGVLQGKPTIAGGVILTTRRDGAADPVGQGT